VDGLRLVGGGRDVRDDWAQALAMAMVRLKRSAALMVSTSTPLVCAAATRASTSWSIPPART